MFFWIILALLLHSAVFGLVNSFALYDRIGGRGSNDDSDRMVRESW